VDEIQQDVDEIDERILAQKQPNSLADHKKFSHPRLRLSIVTECWRCREKKERQNKKRDANASPSQKSPFNPTNP
jgi:hypothetical protein